MRSRPGQGRLPSRVSRVTCFLARGDWSARAVSHHVTRSAPIRGSAISDSRAMFVSSRLFARDARQPRVYYLARGKSAALTSRLTSWRIREETLLYRGGFELSTGFLKKKRERRIPIPRLRNSPVSSRFSSLSWSLFLFYHSKLSP